MRLDFDFGQVHRALALIDRTPLTTGHSLWRLISNEQAYVLEAVWAPVARRVMPRLEEQRERSGFDDVVATLRDLVALERTLTAALAEVPPDNVADVGELSSWAKAFRAAALSGSLGCPSGMIETAADQVEIVVTGMHRKSPWLDGIEGDRAWIRYEASDVP
jgi:hypothetical protein